MRAVSLTEITSHAEWIAYARSQLDAAGLQRRNLDGTIYWSGGTGERVLCLVHGVNDHAGSWAAAAKILAPAHRLIVPDLPGHGESEPQSGPLHMQMLVDRLAAVLDAEAADRLTLAGNSMGAWIAILYTLSHPERVARLLLESGGGLSMPLGVSLVATNRNDALTILRAVHGENAPVPDWAIDALITRSSDSPMLRLLAGGMIQHLVDHRIAQLDVPTTIVWGANDGVVTRPYIDRLQSGIRDAKLCIIDDAAHLPHAQQPERFVACLQATS
jgi:pimeloyl-ACP methyl ester carboxylesterase